MTTLSSWRLIIDPPSTGAWNMAVDEAILEASILGKSLPTLRLYSWQPACLSLGFAQPFSDVNTKAAETLNWHVVRRPTGGRAILHVDEITYSICGQVNEPVLSGTLLESYQKISSALQAALDILGAQTAADERYNQLNPNQPKGPVCFEVPSNYEITSNGKKLIGSAQARRKNALLQHGSLPLEGDLTRITQILNYSSKEEREIAASRILDRATTLEQVLGKQIPLDQAAIAFQAAFSEEYSIQFIPSELSVEEKSAAETLYQTKYNHPQWTERI